MRIIMMMILAVAKWLYVQKNFHTKTFVMTETSSMSLTGDNTDGDGKLDADKT